MANSFKEREAFALEIIPRIFAEEGLPPELGMALARQESNFDPQARNITGGDLERGGAFGWLQMTYTTGRAIDKNCTVAKLHSPIYNAQLAAALCKQNSAACKGRIEDIISRYNSGRDFWRAPTSTKTVYVPNVQKYMEEYKERAAAAVKSPSSDPASPLDTGKTP